MFVTHEYDVASSSLISHIINFAFVKNINPIDIEGKWFQRRTLRYTILNIGSVGRTFIDFDSLGKPFGK